jgi:hypothetical protein
MRLTAALLLVQTDIFRVKMSVSGNRFLAFDPSKTCSVASGGDITFYMSIVFNCGPQLCA